MKNLSVLDLHKEDRLWIAEWGAQGGGTSPRITAATESIERAVIAQVSKESACSAGDPGSIPGSGDPLEKEMATHSSILAWRIPWTEKPGGLQSTGSQRVGHNLVTKPPTGTVMNGFSDEVTLLLFQDPLPQK